MTITDAASIAVVAASVIVIVLLLSRP